MATLTPSNTGGGSPLNDVPEGCHCKGGQSFAYCEGETDPPAKKSQITLFFKSIHTPKPNLQKKSQTNTKNKRKLPKRSSARIILKTMDMVDYHNTHTPTKHKIQTTLDGNIAGGDNDSHDADTLQLPKPAGVLRTLIGSSCNLP